MINIISYIKNSKDSITDCIQSASDTQSIYNIYNYNNDILIEKPFGILTLKKKLSIYSSLYSVYITLSDVGDSYYKVCLDFSDHKNYIVRQNTIVFDCSYYCVEESLQYIIDNINNYIN